MLYDGIQFSRSSLPVLPLSYLSLVPTRPIYKKERLLAIDAKLGPNNVICGLCAMRVQSITLLSYSANGSSRDARAT